MNFSIYSGPTNGDEIPHDESVPISDAICLDSTAAPSGTAEKHSWRESISEKASEPSHDEENHTSPVQRYLAGRLAAKTRSDSSNFFQQPAKPTPNIPSNIGPDGAQQERIDELTDALRKFKDSNLSSSDRWELLCRE